MADEDRTAAARKSWEDRKLAPALKRGAERKKQFSTTSGIQIDRVYDQGDLNGFDYDRDLGYPGDYPFTRGVRDSAPRKNLTSATVTCSTRGRRGCRSHSTCLPRWAAIQIMNSPPAK